MALADTLNLPKTAALLGGQGMPKTPKNYVGLAEKAPVEAELTEAQVKAEKDIGMADIGIKRAEQEQKIQDLEGQQVLAQKAAKDIRALPEREALKTKREEFAEMTFAPTKDNAQDLASLFSLVNVIGMAVGGGGKQNAQQAMYAMNGMLEGYQKGRADLYRKEKDSFDKNFKAMQEAVKTLEKDYEEAVKMYQYDKEAGEIARKLALARSGSPLFKAMEDRVGMVGTLNAIKELRSSVDKGVTLQNNLQAKADAEANAERRSREAMAQRERLAKLQREAKSPATKAQGQNALTFASRVYGNIENATNDLVNLTNLPAVAESPIFAGMIGADRDTVLRNITAFAARKVTNKDQRAFEQIANSLDAALARLEAQGLATGATKAAIQSFGTLKPREGDDAINMAIYLARVKQEIETGIKVHAEMPGATPGQKQNNIQNIERINKTVPFSVEDTLNVLKANRRPLGKKMEQLLSQPQIVPNTSMESQSTRQTQRQNFSSIQEAEAANLAPGTEITINGRNAIVE